MSVICGSVGKTKTKEDVLGHRKEILDPNTVPNIRDPICRRLLVELTFRLTSRGRRVRVATACEKRDPVTTSAGLLLFLKVTL